MNLDVSHPDSARLIEIELNNGTKLQVHAFVYGPYAVHLRISDGEIVETAGWAVTHVRSGLCVWPVERMDEAIACARWLEHHSPLPPDDPRADLYTWPHAHPQESAFLVDELKKIAPRWKGVPEG